MINKAYFRIFCFTAVILLPWGPYSYAGPGTEIKLALIADKALDKSPLVSLLEVELSQKDDIQLLERAQIRQVLEEQELTLLHPRYLFQLVLLVADSLCGDIDM